MYYQDHHTRYKHVKHHKRHLVICIAVIVVLLLCLSYPFLEPLRLQVERTNLTGTTLPVDIARLRLVYVSDIHEGNWPFFTHNQTIDLVRKINALNPDLVILGGDYAMDSESAIAFFNNLPLIRANYGVFAIMGDSDRTGGDEELAALRTAMRNAGITPLVNDVVPVRLSANSSVYLASIDDLNNGWPSLPSISKQVSVDDYVIFLSHSPEIIAETLVATDKNGHKGWYDLGLFGHTHGGQVALIGELVHPTDVDSRYMQGWMVENKAHILISNGVGTTGVPARFLRPPQIHLITITSGK